MTASTHVASGTADPVAPAGRRGRGRSVLPVLSMLVATLIGSLLPLIRTPTFYYWDDTAAAAVGVWQRIAENVFAGTLPFLQIDMWRGGNFIAEAATGMWNPLMLALMLGTYPIDDVAVAITVAKIVLFLVTAAGVYVLARSYGARTWMSAVAGTALALSGWAIFMDGSSWINGSVVTALTPWAWWGLRRCFRRGFRAWDIVLAVALGYLLTSSGNPYGVLTLAVVYAAIAIEAIVARRWSAIGWLFGIGAATVLLVVVVFLPFVLTSQYGYRAASGIWNTEFLAINLSHLLGMSNPTFRPYITMFGGNPMGFPGTYLGWFVLPLLPWLRWGQMRGHWRELSSVLVVGGIFLVFVLGPDQLGMFRWPARLIPFMFTAIIIVFAVVASRGFHADRWRLRALLSGVVILAGWWMAYSDVPGAWKWHGVVSVLIAAGTFITVRWAGADSFKTFLVLGVGTVLALGPQLALAKSNPNVADYQFPSSRSEMRQQFAERSDGLVVQIFDVQRLVTEYGADERWDDLLAGDAPSTAGYESTTAYSGIGFTAFDSALCLTYNGGTCPDAWQQLWREPDGAQASLADLIRAKYVVVQNDYAQDLRAPEGWTRTDQTEVVTIYERDAPMEHPDGTISFTGDGVAVGDDVSYAGAAESASVSTNNSGDRTVVFARIAWPGYVLTVDGVAVPVESGPAGLLTATLPAGLDDANLELRFVPPGMSIGVATAGISLLILIALVIISVRRRRSTGIAPTEPDSTAGARVAD